MGRVKEWMHADGVAVTIQILCKLLEPMMGNLIRDGADFYPSCDWKSGRNAAALQTWSWFIEAGLEIDPRGAYFNQEHLSDALTANFTSKDLDARLDRLAAKGQQSRGELIGLIAYKIRVMFAHHRSMKDVSPKAKLPRLHPFVMFRANEDDDEDFEPEESLVVTGRTFDGKEAHTIMSDGAMIPADKYRTGDHGFAIACWIKPAYEMVLEVPNSCVDSNGQLQVYQPVAYKAQSTLPKKAKSKAKTAKKPSASPVGLAADSSAPDGEAAVLEPGGESSSGIPKMSLMRAGGHGGDAVVFIKTASSDKAQILSVAAKSCEEPAEVCDHCIETLKPTIANYPNMLVSQLSKDLLLELRQLARQYRDVAIADGVGSLRELH